MIWLLFRLRILACWVGIWLNLYLWRLRQACMLGLIGFGFKVGLFFDWGWRFWITPRHFQASEWALAHPRSSVLLRAMTSSGTSVRTLEASSRILLLCPSKSYQISRTLAGAFSTGCPSLSPDTEDSLLMMWYWYHVRGIEQPKARKMSLLRVLFE